MGVIAHKQTSSPRILCMWPSDFQPEAQQRHASFGTSSNSWYMGEQVLRRQPTGPNPLNHRHDFSRLAFRQGCVNSLLRVSLYLPSLLVQSRLHRLLANQGTSAYGQYGRVLIHKNHFFLGHGQGAFLGGAWSPREKERELAGERPPSAVYAT